MEQPRLHVVFNERSGASAEAGLTARELAERLAEAGFEVEIDVDMNRPLADRAAAAASGHADIVVAAGGDGTVTTVASALARGGKTLAILPLGTANLLARDLGIPMDLREAIVALGRMRPRRIDAGEVNGRLFLHKVVIGLAPAIAEEREKIRENQSFAALARLLISFLRRLGEARDMRVVLTINGRPSAEKLRVRAIAIANNAYDEGLGRFFARSRLDAGRLTVYALRRLAFKDFLRLTLRMLLGRWRRDDALMIRQAEWVTLHSRRWLLKVMIDGEVERLATPLRLRILAGAISVLAPVMETGSVLDSAEQDASLAEPAAKAASC
ncbi:diacylglycerol/lipid kinase family protein [Afifella pfennigii]|uniref:diacylglycerol/lipid kinase family protein n=1 Tax=Afifella pfennigii TaxID=209897 RepID=UPI0009FCDD9F|nr:diacylglycerol kinase family protein [Afifella pfennigii]